MTITGSHSCRELIDITEVTDDGATIVVGHPDWLSKIVVDVRSHNLPLDDLWESRQEAMNVEVENNDRWNQLMSSDQTRVAKEMILHALHTLGSDTDWVPFRTEIKDGDVLDIHFRVLLTDVDEEVKRAEADFLKTVDSVRDLHVLDVPEELRVESVRRSV